MDRRKVGKYGENIAADYLGSLGYQVLDRNYFTKYGEIDLICIKKNVLYFVEVKYRRNVNYGTPKDGITPKKVQRIKKSAMVYLKEELKSFMDFKISFLGILGDKDPKFEFIENMLL